MEKRLKTNRCPEFDCRSKKRTKIEDEYLNRLYKCGKCGRLYIPGSHPTKLWNLLYDLKQWITWKIPYRIKYLISEEKQNKKYKQIHDDLVVYFNTPKGKAKLERNSKILQKEAELRVGLFSPEEDEAWGTLKNPCPKCANDCKYFYKIGRIMPDFAIQPYGYGCSCPEFINKRKLKVVDFKTGINLNNNFKNKGYSKKDIQKQKMS